MSKKIQKYFLFYVCGCFDYMYVCASACESQKWASDTLELNLQMFVNYHIKGCREPNLDPLKEQELEFLTTKSSFYFLKKKKIKKTFLKMSNYFRISSEGVNIIFPITITEHT